MNHFTPQCTGQELCLKEREKKPLIICSGICATSRCAEPASKRLLYLFALTSFSTAVCKSPVQLRKSNPKQNPQTGKGEGSCTETSGKWYLLVTAHRVVFSVCVCASFKSNVYLYRQLRVPAHIEAIQASSSSSSSSSSSIFIYLHLLLHLLHLSSSSSSSSSSLS